MKKSHVLLVAVVLSMAQGCSPGQLAQLSKAIGIALPSAPPLSDPSATKAGIITTVAGTGIAGESGDGGPAIEAQIGWPEGLALDPLGQLHFISRTSELDRIRKIDLYGLISTLPSGLRGNGTGTGTMPFLPNSLSFDPWGNLYACASSNNLVMKLGQSGNWMVVAGGVYNTVYRGPRQRGVSDGVFPETSPPEPPLGQEGAAIGDGKPATEAALNHPSDIAVDSSGNLYISDDGYERIRKVDRNGIMSTYAGSGILNPLSPLPRIWYGGDGGPATAAFLNRPGGIALDRQGNLFVADAWNHRIRKIDAKGIITTVAGNGEAGFSGDGGPATEARLNIPDDVAADPFGNLYVADSDNHRIRRVDSKGIITTVAGTGTPNRDPKGSFIGDDGASDGGPALSARLAYPEYIAVDAQGSVYVAETHSHRIRKISFQ